MASELQSLCRPVSQSLIYWSIFHNIYLFNIFPVIMVSLVAMEAVNYLLNNPSIFTLVHADAPVGVANLKSHSSNSVVMWLQTFTSKSW